MKLYDERCYSWGAGLLSMTGVDVDVECFTFQGA